MQNCPRCGTQAADNVPYCPLCGMALARTGQGSLGPEPAAPDAPAQPPADPPANVKKTLFGLSPQPAPTPEPQPAPPANRTLFGVPNPMQPYGPPPEVRASAKTIIGGLSADLGAPFQPPAPVQPSPQDQAPAALGQRAPQEPAPQPQGSLRQTLLGGPYAAPPNEPPAQPPARMNQTMFGLAPQVPQAPAPPQPRAPMHQTLLGLPGEAPPGLPPGWNLPQQVAPAQPPAQQPPMQPQQQGPVQPPQQQNPWGQPAQSPAAPPYGPAPQQVLSANRTMMGVAMPGIAPSHSPQELPPAAQPIPQPMPPQQGSKTMMGVAMPGIAPLRPQQQPQQPPQPPQPPWPQPEPVAAIPQQPSNEAVRGAIRPYPQYNKTAPQPFPVTGQPPPLKAPKAHSQAHPGAWRRPALLLLFLGSLLVIGVTLFALLWSPHPPLRGEARVNAQGKEVLRLLCVNCPDGTAFSIGDQKASSVAHIAEVPLANPLAVGDNKLAVLVQRPGGAKPETVELVVPVAYRIRTDLSELSAPRPTLVIELQASPGTRGLINEMPVDVGPQGHTRLPIDITNECMGQAPDVRFIEKNIPYSIRVERDRTDRGVVAVKVPISPLVIDTPRPHVSIDTSLFAITGRTAAGAALEIKGTPVTVEPSGAFTQKMRLDRLGATDITIRATAKDQAPRITSINVKRVSALDLEAKTFSAEATLKPDTLFTDPQGQAGKTIVLEGEIADTRMQEQLRLIVLDAGGGCPTPPCLVRLLHSGAEDLQKGDTLRVFGHVVGPYVLGDNKKVPELDVDFLLKTKRP